MIVDARQRNWYRVTSPDGATGWMAAAYLSKLND
jgi:SH3-like domain-containing protein